MTTKELTAFLNKRYQIRTKFIGRHIIWQKDEKAVAAQKPKKRPQKPGKKDVAPTKAPSSAAEQETAQEQLVAQKGPELSISELDSASLFTDTFTVDATNLAGMGWQVSERAAVESLNKNIARLDKPEIDRAGNAWYERFGSSLDAHANEFFYGNPRINLHWSNISVNAQYAVRNGAAHYRFGAAYKQPISSNASLSLWFNYGQLPGQNKSIAYQYDSIASPDPDSPVIVRVEGNEAYRLNGNLLKAGLDLNWKLAERLELFSGVVLNRTRTSIIHQGSSRPPGSFFPDQVALREQDFEMLPQFLRISDNFRLDRDKFDRTWIGFQLGLRFYIFIPKNKWE